MEQLIEFISNHYLLAGIWVALAVAIIASFVSSAFSPVKELSTHEATLLINKEDAIILDIRTPAEFKKGHIVGAKQVKADQIEKGELKYLENSKDKPIILVCAMGMTAKKSAMKLFKAGFTKAVVLKGGMSAWQSANLPVAK